MRPQSVIGNRFFIQGYVFMLVHDDGFMKEPKHAA
jgi:hypothetical protein